jgi:hypothetical protein
MTPRCPSASRIPLAEHCVYPWTSGASWPEKGPRTPAQRYGDAFHALAEAIAREIEPGEGVIDLEGKAAAVAEKHGLTPTEERTLLSDAGHIFDTIAADRVRGPRHAEVAAAFDPYTGTRRMLAAVDRSERGEMYARADLVFWREDGALVVRDWKTGERAKGTAPRDTPQLRALAVAFCRPTSDAPELCVRIEVAHVDEEGIEVVGDDLTADDLRETEAKLLDLADRLARPPAPVPGPWCERLYCPMRATCPATIEALATVDAELTTFPLRGPLISTEHAVFLRHRLPVLKEWIADRERAIEAEAKRAPLPVPGKDGVFWGPVEHAGREKVAVTPEAIEIIEGELPIGREVAIEKDMSKASIERGIRKQVLQVRGGNTLPRGATKQLTDKIFRLLREAGAMKRGAKYVRFQEFKKIGDAIAPVEEGEES